MIDGLVDICSHFIDEDCCSKLIRDFDFTDIECTSLVLSRAIGSGMVFFSSFIKIPQILQIIRNESGQGLSIISLYIEITVNALNLGYHFQNNYPFSTYGESFFIFMQNIIIAFYVTHFNNDYSFWIWVPFAFIQLTFIYSVCLQLFSDMLLVQLWSLNVPLSLIYKIPQIYHVYRAKARGELSFLSCFLKAIGSSGRIFTTIREIKDIKVVAMYMFNTILNWIICYQSYTYPKNST